MDSSSVKRISARSRLFCCTLVGVAAGFIISALGHWQYAPLGAWDTSALIYIVWVWLTVWRLDAAEAKALALREDPSRAMTDLLLIIASIASLVAVFLLITKAGQSDGLSKAADISLALFSVIVSWATVHTTYTLKYARLYYGQPEGGIDFNEQEKPKYSDFAYLAFTVGMTFQVSDTQLQSKAIRKTVLHQALLSYLFGTVIIATTINIIVSLSQ